MRFLPILPVALVCAILPVQAQPRSTPASLQAEVNSLVEKLGSRDYKEREQASKTLRSLGYKAYEPLKAALEVNENPEVQRRVEVIVETLAAERLIHPTLVTISAKNQSIKTVIKDLCRQAGYTFQDNLGTDKKITIELKEMPFWEALHKITDSAGIHTSFRDDEKPVLDAYNNESFNPYVAFAGPFKITGTYINSNRNVQLSGIPLRGQNQRQNNYIGMNFSLQAEPKTPILAVGHTVIVKAVDDKGTTMVIPANPGEFLPETRYYHSYMHRSLNQSFGLNFQRGDRDATRIAELKGKVSVLLLSETRPEITVEKLADAAKKKFAGKSIDMEVDEVVPAEGSVALKLTFRQRNANPNDYSWWNSVYQRLVVLDEKGNKFTPNGVNDQTVGVGVVSMRMTFTAPEGKKLGKPSQLVMMEWLTTERIFEFEMKDIPLP